MHKEKDAAVCCVDDEYEERCERMMQQCVLCVCTKNVCVDG